ncbi:MAG: hypothetical protein R3Y54_09700 [Eubacteriales bacterium]
MFEKKKEIKAFQLGLYFSELLLKGVIQPDFQIENIGVRDGKLVLLDFADVVEVKLPEDLTKELLRKLAESLFSLVDSFEGSFSENSYLRAGIISRTGVLGHMIYEAARDNGYSSFIYTEKSLRKSAHSLMQITKYEDIKSAIGEWFQISQEDLCGIEKSLKYHINRYYLDNTRFILNLLDIVVNDNHEKEINIMMSMSMSALQFAMPYTAYGLATKCKLISEIPQIQSVSDDIILKTKEYVGDYEDVVRTFVNNDIFEFMWLLEDLDIIVTDEKKPKEGN